MTGLEALCGQQGSQAGRLPDRDSSGSHSLGSGDDLQPDSRPQRGAAAGASASPGKLAWRPAGAAPRAFAAQPDKHAVRGCVHGMQQRLERLEGRMLRAYALDDTPCVADAACRCEGRVGSSPERSGNSSGAGSACTACPHGSRHAPCRGACAAYASPRRAALLAAMQEEMVALGKDLRGLRKAVPGVFAA
jgi:hypothetical protein